MKDSHNSMSYFHLNCHGMSANWESFNEKKTLHNTEMLQKEQLEL